MSTFLRKITKTSHDRGASAVEYGLLVAAIAAIIVVAAFALGNTVSDVFTDTSNDIVPTATAT
jgi:pilus assembly protein Flp/PilA